MNPAFLCIAVVCGIGLSLISARSSPKGWIIGTFLSASAGIWLAGIALLGKHALEWKSGFTVGGQTLHCVLDPLAAWFLVLLCTVGSAGALYSLSYWSENKHPRSAISARRWWTLLTASMGLLLISANGLQFLFAWEVFALAAYFLVTTERQKRDVRQAGYLYLGASHAATLILFAFFAGIAVQTGTWDLSRLADHSKLAPLFWLALVGFGIKAGIFPLHIWLPSAHANAPSHVSAIMSGVCIKMGIFGLLRFSQWMPVPPEAGWVILTLGVVSSIAGVAFALGQHDLKRLLAYHSVENIGIILLGIGFALIAKANGHTAWGQLAMAGALLHVWNHGLFKSLLFLGAGSVIHACKTRIMSRMGGLWKKMPLTTVFFAIGAAAISGLPPLNGFVSEWLVYLGMLEALTGHGIVAGTAVIPIVALAITGALALACFAKVCGIVFLGAARSEAASNAGEAPRSMLTAMAIPAMLCAIIGACPAVFWPLIAPTLSSFNPAWKTPIQPESLSTLGAIHLGFWVAAACLGFIMLFSLIRSRRIRRSITWDCGYARPSVRMQYTAASFASILTSWFFWLLRPIRHEIPPHGPFPAHATTEEHTPETVLEHIVQPVANGILRLSSATRKLQHGRVQSYILYLISGIIGIALVVGWANHNREQPETLSPSLQHTVSPHQTDSSISSQPCT